MPTCFEQVHRPFIICEKRDVAKPTKQNKSKLGQLRRLFAPECKCRSALVSRRTSGRQVGPLLLLCDQSPDLLGAVISQSKAGYEPASPGNTTKQRKGHRNPTQCESPIWLSIGLIGYDIDPANKLHFDHTKIALQMTTQKKKNISKASLKSIFFLPMEKKIRRVRKVPLL